MAERIVEMMENKKLAIIGTGMMGQAILGGILRNQVLSRENVSIFDADPIKMQTVAADLKVSAKTSSVDAVKGADAVLIAVKPQYLSGVLSELKGKIDPDSFVISIVAGVPIANFQEGLNHPTIVRVMPNTPAQIGEGVSGWIATPDLTKDQRTLAEAILSGTGHTYELKNESQLDQITAVSGSGPAYVFLFIEAMIDTAVHIGIPRAQAEEIVIQTVEGSVKYLEARKTHPAVLRNEVTSPGGTTAEALYEFEKHGFRDAIASAMWACYDRTVALGKNLPRQGHKG